MVKTHNKPKSFDCAPCVLTLALYWKSRDEKEDTISKVINGDESSLTEKKHWEYSEVTDTAVQSQNSLT